MRRARIFIALLLLGCASQDSENAFAPVLSFGPPLVAFGSLSEPGLVFGHISDVEVLPDGSLLIADRESASVLHVTPDGALITGFGGRGEGPGEFQAPVDIALLPNDEYVVLDAERFHATRVKIEDGRHQYVADMPTGTQARKLCTFGSDLVVNALHGDHALLRLDLSGNVVGRGFDLSGTLDDRFPAPAQEDLRDRRRAGVMACLPSGWIAFASEWLPQIYLFDTEGGMRDSVHVTPHLTLQYSLDAGGGMTVDLPPEGWVHRAVTVHRMTPEVVAVQYMRYGPGGGDRDGGPTEIRLIRLRDGAHVIREDSVPFLAHVGASRAWAWRNLPFPQVVRVPFSYSGR